MIEKGVKATEVIQNFLMDECGYNNIEKVWRLITMLNDSGYQIISTTTLERIQDGP